MVTSASTTHHHRSTTKTSNKAFKSRHASKSALKAKNKGKVDDTSSLSRKNHHQQLLSKIERRNKARQQQANKQKVLARDLKIFNGRHGAPRIVAVVPLCPDVNAATAVTQLLKSLNIEEEVPNAGVVITGTGQYKQKIQWITLQREMMAVLDGCKAADYVLLVLSATQQVDQFGESILRGILGQAVSSTYATVQNLDKIELMKDKQAVKKSLLSFTTHFFPKTEKVYDTQNPQESINVMRSLCTTNPKGIQWRDARSYLVAEEVQWDAQEDAVVISGVVRGKGLKADRLVYIQGHGDFQVAKICALSGTPSPTHAANPDVMAMDLESAAPVQILDMPTEAQDDLNELAPEKEAGDSMEIPDNMSETPTNFTAISSRRGVLLDDHHYFDNDIDTLNVPYAVSKKVPKGTSSYQAAWLFNDEDYGSDVSYDEAEDDMDMDALEPAARPEDGEEGRAGPAMTEGVPTEFGDDAKSELFRDPAPEQELAQIQEFRDRQKELEDEREFPDEIELQPNVLARERLSRYRGLKSLRHSKWDPEEDRPFQPEDWDRLARVGDYKRAKTRSLREALVGGVPPGTKVVLYLRASQEIVDTYNPTRPLVLYSILKNEHKQSVVNVSLTASSDYTGEPIKAKDELILQLGPRRLHINPLFSQAGGIGENNIAKFERFLIPGRVTVATFVGPVTFGSVPAVFWKRGDGEAEAEWEMVGQGSFVDVDSERVVAKRIVLTGHPCKIHTKLVTVRYMFFNPEDIDWFKAVPLFTRRGRSGFIKESLGTHGYFKATFDGRINPQDAVGMSLYKRVFPRGSTEFQE